MGEVLASKTLQTTLGANFGISVTDDLYCTVEEQYKGTPLTNSSAIQYMSPFEYGISEEYEPHCVYYNGRSAMFLDMNPNNTTIVLFETYHNTGYFDYIYRTSLDPDHPTITQTQGAPTNNPPVGFDVFFNISTNIPIFGDETTAKNYIEASTDEIAKEIIKLAINYKEVDYDQKKSKYYHLSNRMRQGELLHGKMTIDEESSTWERSTIFMANTMPALYFDDDDFTLHLIAPDVVAGYSLPAPWSVIENVDESGWIEHSTGYDGVYYGSITERVNMLDLSMPDDGTYDYSVYLWTDIPFFGSREEAERAIETQDYTGAGNWPAVQDGSMFYEPDFGEEEEETEFGEGGFASTFVSQYLCTDSDVRRIAQVFFTDDAGLLDDIKKGLELYGAKPVDSIMSLFAFPFNVTQIVSAETDYHVFFGSYDHQLEEPVMKVVNYTPEQPYLDAGTIFLKPIFYNYRDFKDITLSVYLPYIGWESLEIEKYINKNVNIRYYVDINTRQCIVVLIANGVMADYFTGEIGMELPIVGSNYTDYARNEIKHLSDVAKASITPGSTESISNLANAFGSASTDAISKSGFKNYGMYRFGQNGSPKDIQMTKGNYTSGVGMCMPQYVTFRYDIHDVSEPALLNQLYGKPSTASGRVGDFSGFLSGRMTKVNTSGMVEEEINEMQSGLLSEGIFL